MTNSYFTMLFNFIFCHMFGFFNVDEVVSHLLQLGSFHKKLQEFKKRRRNQSTCNQRNLSQLKFTQNNRQLPYICPPLLWSVGSICSSLE